MGARECEMLCGILPCKAILPLPPVALCCLRAGSGPINVWSSLLFGRCWDERKTWP